MKIDFYTTDWCGDCVRSKALLKKFNVDFNEINVDVDQVANEYIKSLQVNQRRIPTIVFEDGTFLVEPTQNTHHLGSREIHFGFRFRNLQNAGCGAKAELLTATRAAINSERRYDSLAMVTLF